MNEYQVLLVSSSIFLALFIFLINDITNKINPNILEAPTQPSDKKDLKKKLSNNKKYINIVLIYFIIFIILNVFIILNILLKIDYSILKKLIELINNNFPSIYYIMIQIAFYGLIYLLYNKRKDIINKIDTL